MKFEVAESNLSLSDSNGIWTHNHLVRKRTLNHLAKLAFNLGLLMKNNLLHVEKVTLPQMKKSLY